MKLHRLITVLLLTMTISAAAAPEKKPPVKKQRAPGKPPVTSLVLGAFHTGKDEKLILVKLTANSKNSDTVWEYNGQQYRAPGIIAAMPCFSDENVLYSNKSGSGAIRVKTPLNHRKFYNLDQGVKIFAPLTVRRGATVSLFAECFSRWPMDLTLKWERKVSCELPGISNLSKDLRLFAAQTKGARFAPGDYYQEKIIFNTSGLPVNREWSCTFTLSMPGKLLLTRSVRFIPAGMLPELSVNQEGNFTDKSGNIVVPVINENKLAEHRQWEFFRAIRRTLFEGKALVIAPEMGAQYPKTFSRTLAEQKSELDFHPWPENNCTSQAAADMLNIIGRTYAETLVLILPPQSLRIGGDQRWAEYTRLMTAAAWARPKMRKVLVITLPAPPAAGESDGFMRSLREMPRASDTELLELDCAGLNWDKKRIFQPAADAQYESSSLPHGAVDRLSRIIMKHIR